MEQRPMPAARVVLPLIALCALAAACGKAPAGDKAGGATEAAAGVTPANVATTPAGSPKRSDGYWEMGSFSSSGTAMSKQFLCVGGGSEDKFSVMDQLAAVGDCSKKDLTRTATGWDFETRCTLMDKETVQKGTITGDFRSSFRIDQTVTQGSAMQKGSVRGKRIGDCAAKYKAGDLVDSDGSVLGNMLGH
jgi:hypothetical protein